MAHLFLALIVGFGVGIVVGALGAGGGILSVPVLVYLLGQEPHAASAGSLVIVGLTAVVSLMPRAKGMCVGETVWCSAWCLRSATCWGRAHP